MEMTLWFNIYKNPIDKKHFKIMWTPKKKSIILGQSWVESICFLLTKFKSEVDKCKLMPFLFDGNAHWWYAIQLLNILL
jgi:hypothetical protein